MVFKGYSAGNRFQLHKRMLEMQHAGKTDAEIATTLGLTCSAVQSFVALFQSDEEPRQGETGERQSRLAYELWAAGKNFAEIGQVLNISRPRACQIIHKQAWLLRRLPKSPLRET